METIRIGTRTSVLALKQTEMVMQALKTVYEDAVFEVIPIKTKGDKLLQAPLVEFGGKGAFVTEFEEALLDGSIDIAVHSAKDMPMKLAEGLCIWTALKRADARDVLVTRKGKGIEAGQPVVIGTSSPRREIQIGNLFPAKCILLRGNVTTRIEKLREGMYDGIILAAAGLERLGMDREEDLCYRYLSYDEMIPAGGQGIVAVEGRETDKLRLLFEKCGDKTAGLELQTERFMLERLQAGCHEPIGVFSQIDWKKDEITIRLLLEKNGKPQTGMISGPVSARLSLAGRLVEEVRKGKRGKVYFIGAGPGDCGLITKRGSELLKTAEVLLYDRLANPVLLAEVPDSCQCIPVGKREGEHTASQEEINELLLRKASEGRRVVRLKGGDSFVFGRGGEEILVLEKEGIPYEVIPGVTSAVGALETAGIPVTHRGMARSFHVITGHTAEEGIPDQFAQYAKLEGTLIFLMGVGNLEKITGQLLHYGKSPDTPAAIVEQGTTVRQRRIDGTLRTILETARRELVKAPAVLVVGEAASCHMISENQPLARCRIGVTGTAHMVGELEPALRELGAWVYGAPYLRIEPTDALAKSMPDWKKFRWLVFTSANGVKQFFEQIHELQMDVRSLSHLKYAVIGRGTADALWKYGIKADHMPSGFTVRELAEGLAKELVQGERICVLRAKEGSADLVKVWKEEKIEYEDIAIYETKVDETVVELLRQQVPVLDYLTFASASGVHGFFGDERESFLGENGFKGTMVCIGNQTKEALTERMRADDQKKIVAAGTHTAEGMIEEILRHHGGKDEK